MADTITSFEPALNLEPKQPEPSVATVNLLDTVPLPSPRAIPPTTAATITSLQSHHIPVFTPGTAEYERAIARSNLLFRAQRPDCVVQPTSAAHVQTAVTHAAAHGVPVAIQSRGHGWAMGFSTASTGIVLDVGAMTGVALAADARTVTVDAGCSWADVYRGLPAGLVVTGARAPTVGVAGFTLGGGLGPFTRGFGLGSDALVDATVVTADGRMVTVGERDDPGSDEGRLFWALRGAGGGNFGVLVRMTLRVRELRGEEVVGGRWRWGGGVTDDVVAAMNKLYATDWPRSMTIDSTWMCDVRQAAGDGVRLVASFDGSKEEFDGVVDGCVEQPELANGLKQRCLPQKSTRFLNETLEAQWAEEIERFLPENKSYSINSSFAFSNDRENVEQITAVIREEMKAFRSLFEGEQADFSVTWMHAGGKAAEKKSSETAFFWREAAYHTYVTLVWEDKRMEKDMRDFLETVKDRLRPFALKQKAAYVNFPDGKMASEPYEDAYFGDNSAELRRVKQIWDKDNFFNWAQGVKLP